MKLATADITALEKLNVWGILKILSSFKSQILTNESGTVDLLPFWKENCKNSEELFINCISLASLTLYLAIKYF